MLRQFLHTPVRSHLPISYCIRNKLIQDCRMMTTAASSSTITIPTPTAPSPSHSSPSHSSIDDANLTQLNLNAATSNTINNPSTQTPSKQFDINGLFTAFKPKGVTTNTVLTYIKHILAPVPRGMTQRQARKELIRIGHGGTLDKAACGIIIIGVGTGTKQLGTFLCGSKTYLFRAQLGVETDTYDFDTTAQILWNDRSYDHVTREKLEEYLNEKYAAQGGFLTQTPPMFSALKQKGYKLSNLARSGDFDQIDLDAKARTVQVYSMKVTEFNPPYYSIEVKCGGGFYVRSLVHDIGVHFGCGSASVEIMRTDQHGFSTNSPHIIRVERMLEEFDRRDAEKAASAAAFNINKEKRNATIAAQKQVHQQENEPTASTTPTETSAPLVEETTPLNRLKGFLSTILTTSDSSSTSSSTSSAAIGTPCTRENILRILSIPVDTRGTCHLPPLDPVKLEKKDEFKQQRYGRGPVRTGSPRSTPRSPSPTTYGTRLNPAN